MKNSIAPWRVVVHPNAKKALERFPRKDAERIEQVLDELEGEPYGGDIEKMSGEANAWRRRVGSYRIFYELSAERRLVLVFRIERRTSATY